ncbi:hypothetical protein Acr_13g0001660 [Actinidia rufa]|uniref:Uncharacterized protein n=1 Tax=Actinidia rufa TaxID=165716 RepID=A0A7J0FJ90_9ERIC|nr:hypothetical protein Acr_13g0001660 [Actinidia rufa]
MSKEGDSLTDLSSMGSEENEGNSDDQSDDLDGNSDEQGDDEDRNSREQGDDEGNPVMMKKETRVNKVVMKEIRVTMMEGFLVRVVSTENGNSENFPLSSPESPSSSPEFPSSSSPCSIEFSSSSSSNQVYWKKIWVMMKKTMKKGTRSNKATMATEIQVTIMEGFLVRVVPTENGNSGKSWDFENFHS